MLDNLKLSHIGWAVPDIYEAVPLFNLLGFNETAKPYNDIKRGVILTLLKDTGNTVIELVAPLNPESPVSNILRTNGPTPYHACFSISNIESALLFKKLENAGFVMIKNLEEAPLLEGKNVVFFYSSKIGIIEVVVC